MTWSLVKEVAWREIRTRARTKAFRWITGILVAGAIIGPIVAAVWPDGGDDLRNVRVGLVEVDQGTEQQILALAEGSLEVTFNNLTGSSPEQVAQALTDGEIDLALEPGPTLVWNQETDLEIASVVNTVLQQRETLVKGQALGLDEGEIANLLTPVNLQQRFADEGRRVRRTCHNRGPLWTHGSVHPATGFWAAHVDECGRGEIYPGHRGVA